MGDDLHRERWQEIEKLLDELLDKPQSERDARLADVRADDAEMHATVLRLLQAADHDSFLDEGVSPVSGEGLLDTLEQFEKHKKLTADSASDEARVIGRYRLERRLGSGGMSEVWLGHRADDSLEQTVAVKLLHPFLGHDAEQRFQRERSVLATLQHEGIARILDAGIATGDPAYLVLEYVDGMTVTDYCRRNKLELRKVLRLFLQVCDAVEYAHRHLVVHRDIKPSNVLVTTDGKVKLLDFGIAKLIDDSQDRALTRSGFFPMTPEYAAPEQIRGDPISTTTDVYGLGSLLYEMLTGGRPFDTKGLSPIEIERLVFDTDPARPSTQANAQLWRGALKGDLDTIILKALQSVPEDRYGSAAELAEDVKRFLDGMPISARSAGMSYRVGKFVRRHRVSLAIGSVVAVFLTVGLVNALVQAERERTQVAQFNSAVTLLFTLFEKVDPDLYPGEQISAVGLLDIGAEQLARFDAGAEPRVDLLRVLGVLYSKLGERDRGEAMLREAVATAYATLEPSNNTIGQTLNSLGRYLAQRGKLSEAEQNLRQGLDALRTAKDDGRWILATERDLADTLALQGRHDEAIRLYLRNIEAHSDFLQDDPRNLTHRNLVMARNELANVYLGIQQLDDASSTVDSAVTMARDNLGADHPELARSLETLALLSVREGKVDDASRALEEALSIFRNTYPKGHQAVGRVLASLAALEDERGNLDRATSLYNEAVAVWSALPDGTYAETADRLHVAAILAANRNNIPEAVELQKAAVAARRRAHESNDHWRVKNELDALAKIEAMALEPSI